MNTGRGQAAADKISRRYVEVGGLRLSYLERGEAARGQPSLLLVHGLMGTARTLAQLMEALPEGQHVLALDLPGAGRSERRTRLNASLYAAAKTVAEFCDAVSLWQPVLVGHSHGGAVGLYVAATEPRRLSGLVLLAPAHPYFGHADQLIRFYVSPLGMLFAHTLPWYPRWVQMAGLRRMAGPQSWDEPARLTPYRENLRTQGTMGHLIRLLRTWHVDMAELRSLMEAPFRLSTLVIWGDHDRAVPVSTAARLMRRLVHGRLRLMEGVGHRPAEERSELCAQWIMEWLRGTEPPPHSAENGSSEAP